MNRNLGRLEKVELRDIWENEARDFTPWLAQPDNLRLLGDTIGMELDFEASEKPVGPFSADILCKDAIADEWVLIENQLERTDHTHLGQLLTYAAGLDAVTIVWIAQRFTDEHRAALDWLNERTDAKVKFFGLEVELWRIGGSAVAPKFNVVSQPNGWTRSVQTVAREGGRTDTEQFRTRYWTAFKAYMEERNSSVRCPSPTYRNWMNHPLGRTGVYLTSIISAWTPEGPEIRCQLTFDTARSEAEFAYFLARKSEIERDLGFTMTWESKPDVKQKKVFISRRTDSANEGQWPDEFEWRRKHLETMERVFRPIASTMPVLPNNGEGA